MKNFTFTAIFASISMFSFSQTVDFENLPLTQAESFYNGADNAGGFTSQGVHFSNSYNTAGGYWSGFAYSNTTDATTAGYGNQYSSFAGHGANNSAKYAVFYYDGKINFNNPVIVDSVKLTNTTYAGISMRDGDAFTKKFGSVNGSDGTPDGTNGEDFFKLWIYGLNQAGNKVDSVAFFLADYRFTDNAQDYILNTWKNVNLQSLGTIYGLSFSLESSDNGDFGMNTPAYFALDNLKFKSALGINTYEKESFAVYPNPVKDVLTVKGGNGNLSISDVTGKVIYSTQHTELSTVDLSALNTGIYMVSIESNGIVSTKTVVK